jgi:hypothetical protein
VSTGFNAGPRTDDSRPGLYLNEGLAAL